MNLRPQRPERCALADCATPRLNFRASDSLTYPLSWHFAGGWPSRLGNLVALSLSTYLARIEYNITTLLLTIGEKEISQEYKSPIQKTEPFAPVALPFFISIPDTLTFSIAPDPVEALFVRNVTQRKRFELASSTMSHPEIFSMREKSSVLFFER